MVKENPNKESCRERMKELKKIRQEDELVAL